VEVFDAGGPGGVGELVPVAGVKPKVGEVEEGLVAGDGVGAEGVLGEGVPLEGAVRAAPSRSASVAGERERSKWAEAQRVMRSRISRAWGKPA